MLVHEPSTQPTQHPRGVRSPIKCVVWDLDNTLWDGVLLEDGQVVVRDEVVETIKTLDARGILHSVASRNDYATAFQELQRHGLADYFLHPQINWSSKAASIQSIATQLNIGIDAIAFVDDQPFELEEVAHTLPKVLCISADEAGTIADRPELQPRFITGESRLRRAMYVSDIQRNQAEQEFVGASEDFLATLDMRFTIAAAQEEDLRRAEELTLRTNQLNTTARTYSYEELDAFRHADDYSLLITGLEDRYGSYGKIGLALVHKTPTVWTIKLLLMSCRVMSRGVGTILIHHLMTLARDAGVRLLAEFIPNDRNRMMYVTYRLGGFSEAERQGDLVIFEADLGRAQPPPQYVQVEIGPA